MWVTVLDQETLSFATTEFTKCKFYLLFHIKSPSDKFYSEHFGEFFHNIFHNIGEFQSEINQRKLNFHSIS